MKEFLEKLSQFGVKAIDLMERGIDKLPDGLQMAWDALVMRTQVTGIMTLIGSFVGLCVCHFILYKCYVAFKKEADWTDVAPTWYFIGCLAACGAFGLNAGVLFNPDYWMMAIYPDKYIISEMLLKFVK